MLTITVPVTEGYDESTSEFVIAEAFTVDLEHSLVSLSKWESFWGTPFMNGKEKTTEQTLSYIEMMLLTPEVPAAILQKLKTTHLPEITAYIENKMTATTFKEDGKPSNGKEIITAEIIYYWMVSLNIPFECQHWHLSRLLTLIRVINLKNAPKKKMSPQAAMAERRRLVAQRRREHNTRG